MPRLVWGALFVLPLLFRIFAAYAIPVWPDEAYYWTWSRQLELHYFDHPPGVAWLLSFTANWPHPWSVRAPALVAALLTVLAASASAPKARLEVLLLYLGAPMFALGGIVATPDVFLVASLALGQAFLRRAEQPRFAHLAVWTFGAAALVKVAGGIVAVGLLVGALRHPCTRRQLRTAGPSLLLVICLVAIWAGFEFSAGRAFTYQWTRVHEAEGTLLGPLLVVVALGLCCGPVGAWAVFHTLWMRRTPEAYGVGALLLVCAYTAAMGSGEWHWVYPAFPLAAPMAATAISRRAAWWCGGIGALLFLYAATGPWGTWSRDPLRRGEGWKQVASEVEGLARAHEAKLLVVRRYQVASALRFHLRERWRVVELGRDRRSQYDLWPRAAIPLGQRVVAVSLGPLGGEVGRSGCAFERSGEIRQVETPRGGVVIAPMVATATCPALRPARDGVAD